MAAPVLPACVRGSTATPSVRRTPPSRRRDAPWAKSASGATSCGGVMADWEWQYWHDRLNGVPAMQYPNEPQAGFYREPRREFYGARKTFRPVAYWPGENGTLHCRLGDEDVTPQRALELWTRCGHHPVTEAAYREVAQRNGLWPDEHELVPMS